MQPDVKSWELTEVERQRAMFGYYGDAREHIALLAAQNATTIREMVKWLRARADELNGHREAVMIVIQGVLREQAKLLEQAAIAAGYEVAK